MSPKTATPHTHAGVSVCVCAPGSGKWRQPNSVHMSGKWLFTCRNIRSRRMN